MEKAGEQAQGHGHGHGHGHEGLHKWEIPDPVYKCKWHEREKTDVKDPHVHVPRNLPKKIYENVLEAIGNTPLIKINKIHKNQGVQAEFLAKCEFLNPGGSLKDRVGWRMILDAQIRGQIKPGDTLVEPTSGNTGIGMAITSAVLGYKNVFSLPEKMSNEKVDVLRALGAEIIRRPTELDHDHPDSYVGAAITRAKQPNHHLLDQYSNASNAMAHYDATSLELLEQCDNKIDYIFISAGTGGALTGIGRRMKEKLPSCKIVAVDPVGSLQALPGSINGPGPGSYRSEGAGHDYIPMAMDRKVADFWVKTDDPDSFEYARALIREEGLLVGGTAGAVLSGAIKFAKEHNLPATARCILVLPDSIRNYITKFVSDSWMVDYHFLPTSTLDEKDHKFTGIDMKKFNLREVPIADENMLVSDALKGFADGKFPVIPIKKNGDIYKVVRPTDLNSALIAGSVKTTDTIYWTGKRDYTIHDVDTINVAQLEKALRRNPYILLTERNDKKELTKCYYADEHDVAKLLKSHLGL